MINGLMFFISGLYFIYLGYSYTKHCLKAFDDKVHDFMLLFIFSMFSFSCEIFNKVTDLDHTGDLKYLYKLKRSAQICLRTKSRY